MSEKRVVIQCALTQQGYDLLHEWADKQEKKVSSDKLPNILGDWIEEMLKNMDKK